MAMTVFKHVSVLASIIPGLALVSLLGGVSPVRDVRVDEASIT